MGFQTSCAACAFFSGTGSPPSRGTRTIGPLPDVISCSDQRSCPVCSSSGPWRAGDAGWPRVVWAAVARQLPVGRRNAIIPRPRDRFPPVVPQRSFTSWRPATGGGRAGLFIPVPCGRNRLHYWLRSALSPRVGQTNPCIPQGYTARSHHPRIVEHRDCPPCGGGVTVIA